MGLGAESCPLRLPGASAENIRQAAAKMLCPLPESGRAESAKEACVGSGVTRAGERCPMPSAHRGGDLLPRVSGEGAEPVYVPSSPWTSRMDGLHTAQVRKAH